MEARTATLTEIRTWLTDYLAAKLERSPEDIDTTEHLMHSGVDSLTMVALGLSIEETFGFEIEPDFFGNFSTVDEVAKAVHDRVHSPAPEASGDAG